MAKHLFLEGLVKTGKSTLLRQCLKPYVDQIGGFSSQRLLDEEDKVCGYRIVPSSNFDLNTRYQPGLPGVFTYHDSQTSSKNLQVFAQLGVDLLKTPGKIILLDEIGGSELLVPPFKDALYAVLQGNTPCIGVLKLNEKASFMSRVSGYPSRVVDENQRLRHKLQAEFDGEIKRFEPETEDCCRDRVEQFIEEVLHVGAV